LFSKIQEFGFVCKNPTIGFACTHWMIQQALPDRSPTASTCKFVTWLWTIVGLRWWHCAALNSRPREHSYSKAKSLLQWVPEHIWHFRRLHV
jgi:hypothetical protein